ncbi:hypothetical protein [Glycomyces sp. NPDC021274]|uniref:hypothetical protein n=1 Tax=Glycomyces sp. NPDC021274 TaxID=3155120 RepID=UPI0033E79118
MEERWTAFVDGRRLERVVEVVTVAAFLEPTCACGSLCMGRYRFWYERAGSLFMVEVDRIRLGWALDELLEAVPPGGYAALPRLARDWNEDTGWCGLGAHFGSAVTADEVTAFAAALEPHLDGPHQNDPPHDRPHRGVGFTAALQDLARAAVAAGAPMWAMED